MQTKRQFVANPQTKPIDLDQDWQSVSSPEMAATIRIHHHHLLLLSPEADAHFTVPCRVEGWVDLVGWLHTENKGAASWSWTQTQSLIPVLTVLSIG